MNRIGSAGLQCFVRLLRLGYHEKWVREWGAMAFVRRTFLVALLLTVPFLLTALMYVGSKALLAATNRTIDPQVLFYASGVELLVFFFIAILEVKDRW